MPTRLSHWALVILFVGQWLGGQFGIGTAHLHLWGGYALLTIVMFRIAWGLAGSDSARFHNMIPSPGAVRAYLPLLFSRQPTNWPGHNPVGALSSLILLALLLVSCMTGLFVETWGEVRGPLAERVSRPTALLMSDIHDMIRWPLYLIAATHVIAVFLYLLLKGEDRIRPIFIHGMIELGSDPGLRQASPLRAPALLALCLSVVAIIVIFGPID